MIIPVVCRFGHLFSVVTESDNMLVSGRHAGLCPDCRAKVSITVEQYTDCRPKASDSYTVGSVMVHFYLKSGKTISINMDELTWVDFMEDVLFPAMAMNGNVRIYDQQDSVKRVIAQFNAGDLEGFRIWTEREIEELKKKEIIG